MSECKWTPGNLIVSWNGYYYEIHAVDEDGRYVDQFCMGAAKDQEANANLISASKDMYEALEQVTMEYEGAIGTNALSDMCNAALAKARGESK